MATPSLYLLGTDLQHLQLIGDIDEADVGRLRPGQGVTFTVDAYPTTSSQGAVTVVRLNSTINNVVTYQAVIAAPNPDLRLLPGMTASLSIETSRAAQTVRVPNSALRFRPTQAIFAALGQSVPPQVSAPASDTAPGVSTSVVGWRLKAAHEPGATIDWFFEPLPATNRPVRVWIMDSGKLVGVPIDVGITDGRWTQVLSGSVRPGEEAVASVVVPTAMKTAGH